MIVISNYANLSHTRQLHAVQVGDVLHLSNCVHLQDEIEIGVPVELYVKKRVAEARVFTSQVTACRCIAWKF